MYTFCALLGEINKHGDKHRERKKKDPEIGFLFCPGSHEIYNFSKPYFANWSSLLCTFVWTMPRCREED